MSSNKRRYVDNIDHELQDAVLTAIGSTSGAIVGGNENATSTSTGALRVPAGGLSTGLDVYVGGKGTFASTAPSTSKSTGALVVAGGIGVSGDSFMKKIGLDDGSATNPSFLFASSNSPTGFYTDVLNAFKAVADGTIVQEWFRTFIRFSTGLYIQASSTIASIPTVISFGTDSQNNPLQAVIYNTSSGGNASTDLVAMNDRATNIEGYVNVGINSSGYATGAVGGASDSYLLCVADEAGNGGNLWVGNTSGGKSTYLFSGTGAPTSSNSAKYDGNTLSAPKLAMSTVGTAAAPVMYFTNATNAGFYQISAGEIGLSFGGVKAMAFSGSVITGTTALFRTAVDGNAGTPSYSWVGETGSGWYRGGTGQIRCSVQGTNIIVLTSSLFNAPVQASFTVGTTSTSTTTGSVVVTGGVGISGNCYVGGIVSNLSATGVSINTTDTLLSNSLATRAIYRLSVTTGSAGIYGSYIISTFDNTTTLIAGSAILVVTVSAGTTVNLKTTVGTYASTNWSLRRDV